MAKGNKTANELLTQRIHSIFKNAGNQVFNYKQVSRKLNIKDGIGRTQVANELNILSEKGLIEEVDTGRYRNIENKADITGTLDFTKQGDAYLISADIKEDLFIKKPNTGTAFQGDLVSVTFSRGGRRGRPQPYVKEIISRAKTTFVGIVEMSKNYAFVVIDNHKIKNDFFINPENINGAKNGEKVLVELVQWKHADQNPEGKIINVFGMPGEHSTEMNAIIEEYNLPTKFPDHVEQAAANISTEITVEEVANRRDMREVPTFTIDPYDAKDFDDALSFQKLPNGNIEVGIHIADVTHYVKQGDVIWQEAENRATSIYLVDRVIPMLPEVLSNNLCSLRPNEDKYTFSVLLEINDKTEIKNVWIGKTVTHSNRRFTYEEAQEIIDGAEGDFKEEILTLHNFAKVFREKRLANGAMGFGSDEVKFRLDENGKPVEVFQKKIGESNHLIEEFMLLANKKVAESIALVQPETKPKTFIYRIHDQPNPEKISQLSTYVFTLGFRLNRAEGKAFSRAINALLAEVKDKPEENMISLMAVRTMEKAVYSANNIGHFGLAFDHYSHFTSPIRRFPDMIAHKLLFEYANGAKSADANEIERLCKHSSNMEKRAADAERASIKYKQMEYLLDRKGEEFDGCISGLTTWGMYVMLDESKCEGMVSVRNLPGDDYYFDEDKYELIGRKYKESFRMGQGVRIKITNVDLTQKQADFELLTWDEA